MDRERGAEGEEKGISHSVSLMRDLEELEKRAVTAREESRKDKDGQAWKVVETERKGLEECFL